MRFTAAVSGCKGIALFLRSDFNSRSWKDAKCRKELKVTYCLAVKCAKLCTFTTG